jgi:hypothetical protein
MVRLVPDPIPHLVLKNKKCNTSYHFYAEALPEETRKR